MVLHGMLDSGSMACTMTASAEQKWLEAEIISDQSGASFDVMLVGCGVAELNQRIPGRTIVPATKDRFTNNQ